MVAVAGLGLHNGVSRNLILLPPGWFNRPNDETERSVGLL